MLKKWLATYPPPLLPYTHLFFSYYCEFSVVGRNNMDPNGQICVKLPAL